MKMYFYSMTQRADTLREQRMKEHLCTAYQTTFNIFLGAPLDDNTYEKFESVFKDEVKKLTSHIEIVNLNVGPDSHSVYNTIKLVIGYKIFNSDFLYEAVIEG